MYKFVTFCRWLCVFCQQYPACLIWKAAIILLPVFLLCGTVKGALPEDTVAIVVPPDQPYMVVDQLDGVEAKYREGAGNDVTGAYSCARYVTTYYQAVYGITVNNLIDAGPPLPMDKLIRVDVPQKGDIIFYPSPPNANNHSAIVKSFDGNKITLIEQNYKWMSEGLTYAKVNRTISYPGSSYIIYRAVDAPLTQTPTIQEEPYRVAAPVALSEPDLMAKLAFREFTDIDMSEQEPGLIHSDTYDTFSFIGSELFSFSVPLDFELCLYYDSLVNPSSYKLANPGETVTAISAVFRRPAATAAVFAQTPTAPEYRFQATITIGSSLMLVNGVSVTIDSPAYIENGRTMLPVKWLATALGIDNGNIQWSDADRTVIIIDGERQLRFTIGSNILNRHDGQVIMDVPSVIQYDRAYLPVRYLADALDVEYRWDDEEKTLTFYAYNVLY